MHCHWQHFWMVHPTTGALQILQYNAIRCIQMNHVLLEFLHSKQTEEEAILKADEMVTVAERQQEGRAYAIIAYSFFNNGATCMCALSLWVGLSREETDSFLILQPDHAIPKTIMPICEQCSLRSVNCRSAISLDAVHRSTNYDRHLNVMPL